MKSMTCICFLKSFVTKASESLVIATAFSDRIGVARRTNGFECKRKFRERWDEVKFTTVTSDGSTFAIARLAGSLFS